MEQDMKGRVAVVTGGSEGIGYATSALLARRGAHVVICARRQEKLDEAVARIRQEGGSVEAIKLDVSDNDAFESAIQSVADRKGRLDYLVNNAMSVGMGMIDDIAFDDWRKDFAVNADAVFIGMRAAIRIMKKGGGGAIVNTASTCGFRAQSGLSSYSASKAALIQLTSVAAMEGARFNIRVNSVAPGQIVTAASEEFLSDPVAAGASIEAIPFGRPGNPDEVAQAIAFLLSDHASYITGAMLPVDGGKAVQLYIG